jgi:hypothetical protein
LVLVVRIGWFWGDVWCWGAGGTVGVVDYESAALAFGNHERLSRVLRGREGWRPEVQDGDPYWCFGVDGEARILITAEPDGFGMFVSEWDRSWVIPRLDDVVAWLGVHEGEFRGLSPMGVVWKAAFEEARAAGEGGLRLLGRVARFAAPWGLGGEVDEAGDEAVEVFACSGAAGFGEFFDGPSGDGAGGLGEEVLVPAVVGGEDVEGFVVLVDEGADYGDGGECVLV